MSGMRQLYKGFEYVPCHDLFPFTDFFVEDEACNQLGVYVRPPEQVDMSSRLHLLEASVRSNLLSDLNEELHFVFSDHPCLVCILLAYLRFEILQVGFYMEHAATID